MSLTRRLFSTLAVTASFALAACGGGGSTGGSDGYDRVIGSADAPVTMVEYASVACGHCATFHEEVWATLKTDYVDTGRVQYMMREMVTGTPQFAIAGFALARCVPEDRYYDTIDLLFQQQRAIFQAASRPGGARNQYLAIASSMGLSEDQFNACLSDEDINRGIIASHEQAAADGIDGTPRFLFNDELLESRRAPGASEYTYFLGGRQLLIDGETVPGIVDAETFRRILDHLIALNSDAGAEG